MESRVRALVFSVVRYAGRTYTERDIIAQLMARAHPARSRQRAFEGGYTQFMPALRKDKSPVVPA